MQTTVIYRTKRAPSEVATCVAIGDMWRALQYDDLFPADGWQSFVSSLGSLFNMPPVRTRPTEPRTLRIVWMDIVSVGAKRVNGLTLGTRNDPEIVVVGQPNGHKGAPLVSQSALCHEIAHVACWRARGTGDPYHGLYGGPFNAAITQRVLDVDAGLARQGL